MRGDGSGERGGIGQRCQPGCLVVVEVLGGVGQPRLIPAFFPCPIPECESRLADGLDHLVMIAHDAVAAELADQRHALGGRGTVADDVAEEHDARRPTLLDLAKNGFEGWQIAVNVGKYGDLTHLQVRVGFGRSPPGTFVAPGYRARSRPGG